MTDLKSSEIQYGERIDSGGSDAILASYFRDILLNLHIDGNRFQALLDRYILKQKIATNTTEISTARSAMRRELMHPTMTWKVFIKGLMFLRVKEVVMTLTLYRTDEPISEHECRFKLTDQNLDDHDDDQDKVNILQKFFRDILTDLDITPEKFDYYMDLYVRYAKPGSSAYERYGAKSLTRREILKNSISWKVFVKGLIFLRTYKVIMRLKLIHQNNIISRHEKTLVFA